MKSSREAVVRFVALIAVLALLVGMAFYAWGFLRCFGEAKLVPDVAQYPVARVLFYGSGSGTVSARFSLFDTAGREFCVIDRSWSAASLSVDFATACFSGKEFAFPFKIRPSERKNGGTVLPHYYLDHGQCMLLGEPCTVRQKKAMNHLATFALAMTTKFATRFSSVRTINLSQCEMGKTYDIITDSHGLLMLVQM
ncbi:MAG: hypothetical protein K6G80_06545 [Treponema sp.]|nr:hypothetical protein [Treponema sp.]